MIIDVWTTVAYFKLVTAHVPRGSVVIRERLDREHIERHCGPHKQACPRVDRPAEDSTRNSARGLARPALPLEADRAKRLPAPDSAHHDRRHPLLPMSAHGDHG